MLDHPDVVGIFGARRAVEGVDGLTQRERLTATALEGIAVIDDAVDWKREVAAKAAAAKTGGGS